MASGSYLPEALIFLCYEKEYIPYHHITYFYKSSKPKMSNDV